MKLDVLSYVNEEYKKIEKINEKVAPLTIVQFKRKGEGENPSDKYVGNKIKLCDKYGISTTLVKIIYDELDTVDIEKIRLNLERLSFINLIVQKPFPKEVSPLVSNLLRRADESADIDGIGRYNKRGIKEYSYSEIKRTKKYQIPCTARGIIDYMQHIDTNLEGKSILIINRSELVGDPLAKICNDLNMMVTVAHSHISKEKILQIINDYDYVVLGIGKKDYLKMSELNPKNKITVIDVGINFNENGKMCGDFTPDIENEKVDYTPVPNGVGRLTTLSLIKNVYGI